MLSAVLVVCYVLVAAILDSRETGRLYDGTLLIAAIVLMYISCGP